MKISKKQKKCFFLMSQGSKNQVLRSKGVLCSLMDRQTDTKVKTQDILSCHFRLSGLSRFGLRHTKVILTTFDHILLIESGVRLAFRVRLDNKFIVTAFCLMNCSLFEGVNLCLILSPFTISQRQLLHQWRHSKCTSCHRLREHH